MVVGRVDCVGVYITHTSINKKAKVCQLVGRSVATVHERVSQSLVCSSHSWLIGSLGRFQSLSVELEKIIPHRSIIDQYFITFDVLLLDVTSPTPKFFASARATSLSAAQY